MSTFIVFMGLLFLGVPIALVLALTALFYILVSGNLVLLDSYPQQLFSALESYGLLAIPLFMLTGELMNEGGLTKRLINVARVFVGGFRGGLAYINLAANMMMASIMGSAVAQIAIMSKAMVPEMEKDGYDKPFSTAITAAGGLLSPIIPPSMVFVLFGVLAQVPIAEMFIAGILPGLLMAGLFFIVIAVMGLFQNYPKGVWPNREQIKDYIIMGMPAALVPLIIIGSIMTGLATPTEAAALASIASLMVGKYVYKDLQFSHLLDILKRTAINSSMVLILIAAAGLFGWVIIYEQIPQKAALLVAEQTNDPFIFLLIVVGILLLVGMVLDGIAALILIVPILLPVAQLQFGISPHQFGVVISIALILGLLTPPVGAGLFVASAMTGTPPAHIFKALLPFLLSTLVALVLISFLPWLSTGLL